MSLNDTSGGMESAAPPTRDCAGDVVEKHCVRGEKAGARKMGREPRWKGSRRSWRAQRWGMEHDMVICACWVGCCDCGLWILFRRWIASNGFSVHVIIYILSGSRVLAKVSFYCLFGISYHDLDIIHYALNCSAMIFESIVSRKFDVEFLLLHASIARGC